MHLNKEKSSIFMLFPANTSVLGSSQHEDGQSVLKDMKKDGFLPKY